MSVKQRTTIFPLCIALLAGVGVFCALSSPILAQESAPTKPPKVLPKALKSKRVAAARSAQTPQKPTPKQISVYQDIVNSYVFVGDFSEKPEGRTVSDELFWTYRYKLPEVIFEPVFEFEDVAREFPATKGSDRPAEHINRGRVLFLQGEYEEAKSVWATALNRFGKTYPFNRRNDYFMALAFMQLAAMEYKKTPDWQAPLVRSHLSNAATFLSWAFIVKKDDPDELLDTVAPKQLYNLAAIYFMYQRKPGAYGAAQTGLDYLRRTGRADYRPQLRRILAESLIAGRAYLEAVQEFDTAIRQDQDPRQAAAMFARVGDIYFDLHNYELAEDAYTMAGRIDEELRAFHPMQLVLRGESLFWLGKFSEAQKIFYYALNGSPDRQSRARLSKDSAAFALMRIADAYLARKQNAQARLNYFRVIREYRDTEAARMAAIRHACLELPFYEGKNINHARAELEKVKTTTGSDGLPPPVVELGWACQVASYAERERTRDMVERVRTFSAQYPESRFLKSLTEPVRAVQADRIQDYLAPYDPYNAISFFEKNRKNLFPKVDEPLGARLFRAYVDVNRSAPAKEFWGAYERKSTDSDKLLVQAIAASEFKTRTKSDPNWTKVNQDIAATLTKTPLPLEPTPEVSRQLTRLLAQPKGSEPHLPWIYSLAKTWSAKDKKFVCDLEYPLLSLTYERKATSRVAGLDVKAEVTRLITTHLPAAFAEEGSCAFSLLDLEAKLFASEAGVLAERYLKREAWGINDATVRFFWGAAERAWDAGAKEKAKALWQLIADKGPKGSPEVSFAKSRLDPTQTEFEQLWR